MPRGPKGEKHPANPFEAAVIVGRIATGEVEDAQLHQGQRATDQAMGA